MIKDVKLHIENLLGSAIKEAKKNGSLAAEVLPRISLEIPKLESHGDIASNICFLIGKQNRINPRTVASAILKTDAMTIHDDAYIDKVEVAGPGFLNFFLKPVSHYLVIDQILRENESYGSSDIGLREKVLIEFVSANPTGPLHIGHARNAVVGDVLARLFKFSGYDVTTEYYLNDSGKQIVSLGESLKARRQQIEGKELQEDLEYRGEYLVEIARELHDSGSLPPENDDAGFYSAYAVKRITELIREDLEAFSISFDRWFKESALHEAGMIEKMSKLLLKKGAAAEKEGALWFFASRFGDEKDRVVIRNNGVPTYLAADIAYHYKKLKSGFSRLVNVWGADHHGYIPRIKGVIQSLGYGEDTLDVVLIQLVKLMRSGKPVPMSTRSGEFITLREVLDEVGNDSLRFFMLMRRSDAQLDFDIELAKKHSVENPVYYVQYAHARICSLIKKARENNLETDEIKDVSLDLLKEDPEIALIKVLGLFPETVEGSVRSLEPHRLTSYLQDAAARFHNFYDNMRVVGEDEAVAKARLLLVYAAGIVLRNGLGLIGVSCPEEM